MPRQQTQNARLEMVPVETNRESLQKAIRQCSPPSDFGGSPRSSYLSIFRTSAACVLAMLLLLSVSCTSQGSQQQQSRAPVPVKVVHPSMGDVAVTLAYTGEVKSGDQVDIVPSSSGRIVDIFVEEGAEVSAGMPLARLETDTLEVQVRQADANLQSAQSRLDTVLQGARPEEIAASRAFLESLRNRLRGMLNGGRPEEIAAAEATRSSARAAVLKAQADLASAQQRLDQLRNPAQADISTAQLAVDSTTATLASAQAKFDDLKASPRPADVAAAQATLSSAQSAVRAAESNLAILKLPLNKVTLQDLINAYTGVSIARGKLASDKERGASADIIAADEDALILAYRRLQVAEEEAGTFKAGVSAEQLIASQAALDSARASVDSAQAKLDLLMAGPTSADFATAQSAVDNARANLETSRIKLDRLKNPVPADIAAAQAVVESGEAAIQTALASVATAESNFAKAKMPSSETDIGTQRALLDQAEQQFSLVQSKFTSPDVAAATAGVAQVQAALDLARLQLSKATLTAPFAAIVSKKHFSKGAFVSTQSAVFSLVSKDLRVVFNVEESTIGRLKTGLPVTLTTSAPGDRPFQGQIKSIAPSADPTSRSFKIEASLAPSAQQNIVRSGMSVNASVAVAQQLGVLLVPKDAVIQQGNKNFVFVVKDGVAERVEVEIGLSDDRVSEVRSGLDVDQQVVVQGNKSLRAQDRVSIIQ